MPKKNKRGKSFATFAALNKEMKFGKPGVKSCSV